MGRIERALSKAREEQENRLRRSDGVENPASELSTPTTPGFPSELPREVARKRHAAPAGRVKRLGDIWSQLESNTIQMDDLEGNRVIEGLRQPAITSSYKMLRTRLKQRLRANGTRTLAITSAGSGDGKTLTSVNLALSLARDIEQYVVLVDFDLRRPSVARTLGLEGDACRMSTLLSGETDIPGSLIRTQLDRIAFLLNDEPHVDSSEVLAAPGTVDICRQLRSMEDCLIIYDMPPVLATDDLLAFSPLVESVLVVVTEGRTNRADLARVHDLLEGVNVIGTVLNRSMDKAPTYY